MEPKEKKKIFTTSRVVGYSLFVAVVALLVAIAIPQFKCWGCGTRAYDPDTKANLHNVYLACKAFWADSGADRVCRMDIATSTAYGYIQTRNVKVVIYGNEKSFVGLGYNIKNNKAWKIDAKGTIE